MASAASIVAPKLSQAALARELDVSRQAVNDLVKRGILPIDKDGLIDVELARHAIANRVRPSGKTAAALNGASPAAAPADSEATATASDSAPITSYHVAKTLREAAEAKMANLRLGWTSSNNRYGVAVFGENLLDNQYVTALGTYGKTVLGTVGARVTAPRLWGVEFSANF